MIARVSGALLLASALAAGSGCRRAPQVPAYPIQPRLSQPFPVVYLGGPLELHLTWEIGAGCPKLPDYRVFVHYLDPESGRVHFFYDHDPPQPTSQWRAGSAVSYALTTFLEGTEHTGRLEIWVGLYPADAIRRRPRLQGQTRGKHGDATHIGDVEFRPRSQRYLPLYKAGWYEVESDPGLGQWRWTSKRSVASFKAPPGAALLYLEASFPTREVGGAQALEIRRGQQLISRLERHDPEKFITAIPVPAGAPDDGGWFDLTLETEPAFQPSLLGPSGDTRELGVKIHHLFLRPLSGEPPA
jgi:hypothetical protein